MTTSPKKLFVAQLPLIERVIESVCRHHCCFGPDAEDFSSTVKLKLMDNDYAVLRKFRGQSQLSTYLTTVVANQFKDYRIQNWGKWRPSALAKRLGRTAVQLEILRSREGHSFREAVEMLRNQLGDESPPAEELDAIDAQLPARVRRRFEGEERLRNLPARIRADERVIQGERSDKVDRARASLARALAGLEAEDRLIIKMRFEDGFKVSVIARQLDMRQRLLYSRIEKVLKTLRKTLEDDGVGEDVADFFG